MALGADGVLVGTRFCAAEESLVRPLRRAALVDADGDSTATHHVEGHRSPACHGPKEFTARVQRNRFVERWHGHESELAQQAAVEAPRYLQAFADGDPDDTAVWFGEAAGLIGSVGSVASIIQPNGRDGIEASRFSAAPRGRATSVPTRGCQNGIPLHSPNSRAVTLTVTSVTVLGPPGALALSEQLGAALG